MTTTDDGIGTTDPADAFLEQLTAVAINLGRSPTPAEVRRVVEEMTDAERVAVLTALLVGALAGMRPPRSGAHVA